jgi:hypothetical protein
MLNLKIIRADLLSLALILIFAFAANNLLANGTITKVSNKGVRILKADDKNKADDKKWTPAKADMTLEKGDRISVKPGSSLIVTLKDGTIIDINGGSDVVIMNDGIIINSGSIAVIEGSITVLNSKTQESYSLFSGQGISFNKDGKTSGVQPLSKDYAGEVAPSPSVPERPEKPASRI